MTDKRIKMDCPFCHTPANEIQVFGWNNSSTYGEIYCPNPKCHVRISGCISKQELISRWNRR